MTAIKLSLTNVSRPWLAEPTAKAQVKIKKGKLQPAVLDGFFEQCSKRCDDPYWADILHEMALGKPPKKFSVKDHVVYFKRGSKVYTVMIPENYHEAISVIVEFIRHHSGKYSEMDQDRNRKEELARLSNRDGATIWTKVSKEMRVVLIINYVTELRKVHKLNIKEVTQLNNIIHIGIALRYFRKENIVLSEDRIERIEGLIFDPTTRRFSIDPNLVPSKASRTKSEPKEVAPCVDFWELWDRMVQYLQTLGEHKVSNHLEVKHDTSRRPENSSSSLQAPSEDTSQVHRESISQNSTTEKSTVSSLPVVRKPRLILKAS